MIDISDWKEFRVGDLFEKLDLKCKKSDFNKASDVSLVKNDEFNLPLVNAKHGNNGIMYYGREKDWDSAEMTIDIVEDGASSTGDVYAQPYKTGVLYNAYLVKPLWECTSEHVLQYMACLIEKCVKSHFGYENKCTWDKVKKEMIKLPVTQTGKPDWDYMESYMKSIMGEAEESIEKLKRASCDTKQLIDVSGWGEFSIKDIFNVVKGTRLTKANMKEGNIKFIGSSAMNNGETQRIGNIGHLHPANTITVCYNGSIGETFYQDEPFWASDDVNVLYPKFELNKYIAFFICPIIKTVGQKYAFVDKWKQEDMKDAIIKLPITSSGEPDWQYMESYMKAVMDESENNLAILKTL